MRVSQSPTQATVALREDRGGEEVAATMTPKVATAYTLILPQ